MTPLRFILLCGCSVFSKSTWAQSTSDKPISAEFMKTDFHGKKTHVSTLDNPEFQHHDPSDIIEYNDRYYLWYTEHPKVKKWLGKLHSMDYVSGRI